MCVCVCVCVVKFYRNYCGPDQYYDAVAERCVECSIICRPELDTDYCANNCPGSFQRSRCFYNTRKVTVDAPQGQHVLYSGFHELELYTAVALSAWL